MCDKARSEDTKRMVEGLLIVAVGGVMEPVVGALVGQMFVKPYLDSRN